MIYDVDGRVCEHNIITNNNTINNFEDTQIIIEELIIKGILLPTILFPLVRQ
jgi:hypothetical protein